MTKNKSIPKSIPMVGNFSLHHDKDGWSIGVEFGKEFEMVGPRDTLKAVLKHARLWYEGQVAKAAFRE